MTETPTDGGGPIVPGPGGRIEDPVGGFEAMGDRFLEQDMLAGLQRLDGKWFVQVVGQHQIDRIEVTPIQRLVERRKNLRAARFGGNCFGPFDDRVDARRDANSRAHFLDSAQVAGGDSAAADKGKLDL